MTEQDTPKAQPKVSEDREMLHKIAVTMERMHETTRVRLSPTARMVLRQIGYIMAGTPPEKAVKLEGMFERAGRP